MKIISQCYTSKIELLDYDTPLLDNEAVSIQVEGWWGGGVGVGCHGVWGLVGIGELQISPHIVYDPLECFGVLKYDTVYNLYIVLDPN